MGERIGCFEARKLIDTFFWSRNRGEAVGAMLRAYTHLGKGPGEGNCAKCVSYFEQQKKKYLSGPEESRGRGVRAPVVPMQKPK